MRCTIDISNSCMQGAPVRPAGAGGADHEGAGVLRQRAGGQLRLQPQLQPPPLQWSQLRGHRRRWLRPRDGGGTIPT